MGGGLMQLVAYGAQDIYLTGQPQITFFKLVYKRHTNFAVEAISQTFNGNADFGTCPTCTISRCADLINRMYLEFTTLPIRQVYQPTPLPTGTVRPPNDPSVSRPRWDWVNSLGHAIVKSVKVEIGGQQIDKHYGTWLEIWSELTQPAEKVTGYQQMVGKFATQAACLGNSINANTYYVPLQFWFCRNVGLSLPLIALQYHEVKVSFELRPLNECVQQLCTIGGAVVPTGGGATGGQCGVGDRDPGPDVPWQNAAATNSYIQAGHCGCTMSLWVDYVYLDTQERRLFAQKSHEYLIDQLQVPFGDGGNNIVSNIGTTMSQSQIRLNFNHPVKELLWTLQSTGALALGSSASGNDLFNFSTRYPQQQVGPPPALGPQFYSQTIFGPLQAAKLILNGHDRMSYRSGHYFNQVVPYERHTRCPGKFIYDYSFALRPEDHQPSGTCNFSRIDNAQLDLRVAGTAGDTMGSYTSSLSNLGSTNGPIGGDPWNSNLAGPGGNSQQGVILNVYATNYNVLRIMSGMGGLAYSN